MIDDLRQTCEKLGMQKQTQLFLNKRENDFSEEGESIMGTIYKGTGWSHSVIGETKDGTIYKGTGWGRTAIGEYKDGTIYKGTGWGKDAIGEYEGDPAGAAALLLLQYEFL